MEKTRLEEEEEKKNASFNIVSSSTDQRARGTRARAPREYSHLPSFALRCRIFYRRIYIYIYTLPWTRKSEKKTTKETKREETVKKNTHTIVPFFQQKDCRKRRPFEEYFEERYKENKNKKIRIPSRTSGPHHTPHPCPETHILDLRYD